jgi:hypothetical protein
MRGAVAAGRYVLPALRRASGHRYAGSAGAYEIVRARVVALPPVTMLFGSDPATRQAGSAREEASSDGGSIPSTATIANPE